MRIYRLTHRATDSTFTIWFVCAGSRNEAKKILSKKAGPGVIEFPKYQGIPERQKGIRPGGIEQYEPAYLRYA